jgi:DNA repair exonuclease SbcCD nuclease subunit
MYTKQEASQLRQQFWTAFGMYMQPIPSAEEEKINWVNYKTGDKYISFKMQTIGNDAFVAIELTHKDPVQQQLVFDKFSQFKKAFRQIVKEDWQWQLHTTDEHGTIISRIYKQLENVNVLNKENWPQLISFFKPGIISLDQFWSEYKYAFEE